LEKRVGFKPSVVHELGGIELDDVDEVGRVCGKFVFSDRSRSVTSVTRHAMSRPQDDRNQEATVYLVSILYPYRSLKSHHSLAGKS
jgi:hypothetical protein